MKSKSSELDKQPKPIKVTYDGTMSPDKKTPPKRTKTLDNK